jgi:predicted metal-dependent hydrolase
VDRATELITARVNAKARKMNLAFNKIRITSAQQRWGSCSFNGNLNFSWRLIMAPIEVIDCVVVHELVHLIEHNHSSEFWARVYAEVPDYKESHKWLRDNNYLLNI